MFRFLSFIPSLFCDFFINSLLWLPLAPLPFLSLFRFSLSFTLLILFPTLPHPRPLPPPLSRFKSLLLSHDPKDLLGREEYETLAKKINEKKKRKERRRKNEEAAAAAEADGGGGGEGDKGDKKEESVGEEEEEEEEKVDLEIATEDKRRAQEKLISMKVSFLESLCLAPEIFLDF